MSDKILLDNRDGVRVLTLNRPQKKNAIDTEMWVAIRGRRRQVLVEGRLRPDPETGGPRLWTRHNGTVGKVRRQDGGHPGPQSGSCAARAAVVHHRRHLRKEPAVWRGWQLKD